MVQACGGHPRLDADSTYPVCSGCVAAVESTLRLLKNGEADEVRRTQSKIASSLRSGSEPSAMTIRLRAAATSHLATPCFHFPPVLPEAVPWCTCGRMRVPPIVLSIRVSRLGSAVGQLCRKVESTGWTSLLPFILLVAKHFRRSPRRLDCYGSLVAAAAVPLFKHDRLQPVGCLPRAAGLGVESCRLGRRRREAGGARPLRFNVDGLRVM